VTGQRFTIARPIPGPVPTGEDFDAHVQAAQMQWHEDLAATGWRPVGDPTFTVEPAYSFDNNMSMTWIRVTGLTDRPLDPQ